MVFLLCPPGDQWLGYRDMADSDHTDYFRALQLMYVIKLLKFSGLYLPHHKVLKVASLPVGLL